MSGGTASCDRSSWPSLEAGVSLLSSTIAAFSAHLTLAELPIILPERSRIGTKILLWQYQFYSVEIYTPRWRKILPEAALRIQILAASSDLARLRGFCEIAAKGVADGAIDQS